MTDHVAVGSIIGFVIGFVIGLIADDTTVVNAIMKRGEALMRNNLKIVGHVERKLRNGAWSKDI